MYWYNFWGWRISFPRIQGIQHCWQRSKNATETAFAYNKNTVDWLQSSPGCCIMMEDMIAIHLIFWITEKAWPVVEMELEFLHTVASGWRFWNHWYTWEGRNIIDQAAQAAYMSGDYIEEVLSRTFLRQAHYAGNPRQVFGVSSLFALQSNMLQKIERDYREFFWSIFLNLDKIVDEHNQFIT